MPETRRTIRAAGWGVLTVVLGCAAVTAWYSTPRPELQTWLACALSALTAVTAYLCFGEPLRMWSTLRHRNVSLAVETIDNQVRLCVTNLGPTASISVQAIGLCQPPTGRPKGLQHWPIPWLQDRTVEAKPILSGQTRTLDFAKFDLTAVKASLSDDEVEAVHWQFSSVPEPVGVRYYNLRRVCDVEEQEFILTIRLMNADSGRYHDWQVTLRVKNLEVGCELMPIKRSRFSPTRYQTEFNASRPAKTHQARS
jgi:hypothetical protein